VSTAGASAQKACALGTYAAAAGSITCTPAAPGSFVGTTGATKATLCAAGSFSASSGASSCTHAPAGSYVSGAGAKAATPCAIGTYDPAIGATKCLAAPLNTYVATAGATAATTCPLHTFTLQTGSTSKAACVKMAITTTSLIGGKLGSSYYVKLTVKGGKAPYHWSMVTGTTLPPGLKLNGTTGAITGKPTLAGTFTFIVKVKDTRTSTHAQLTAKATLSITITT